MPDPVLHRAVDQEYPHRLYQHIDADDKEEVPGEEATQYSLVRLLVDSLIR